MQAQDITTKSDLWQMHKALKAELREIKHLLNMLVSTETLSDGGRLKPSYSAGDLCEMFSVTNGTIRNWREKGILKGFQPSGPEGKWVYPFEKNRQFIQKRLGLSGRSLVSNEGWSNQY